MASQDLEVTEKEESFWRNYDTLVASGLVKTQPKPTNEFHQAVIANNHGFLLNPSEHRA